MEGKDLECGRCLEHPWEEKGGVLSCVKCCTKGRTSDMTVTKTLLLDEEADNREGGQQAGGKCCTVSEKGLEKDEGEGNA